MIDPKIIRRNRRLVPACGHEFSHINGYGQQIGAELPMKSGHFAAIHSDQTGGPEKGASG
ncbi:hypothetical protein P8T57_08945 [Thalassospira sp. SN3W]|uniref:hypothetical protein n=1 Tax=Thalassospira sp. SN3W TaxID=3035476 RepID=UPI00311B010F